MTAADYHRLPAEVPAAPVGCPVNHEFSPLSHDYLLDPYEVLAGLRSETPVFYSDVLRYLVVTRMEDVSDVFLDHDSFGSQNVQDPVFGVCDAAHEVLAAADFNPVAVMSNRQPPDHGRIRQHTKNGFSNRRMRLLAPYIRRRSGELADAMLSAGPPADFVECFGHPLPGETIWRFIGFPTSDDERLKHWCSDRLAFTWGQPDEAEQVDIAHKMLSYWRYCRSFVAQRAVDPADDFTSELLAVHHGDAEQLSYREVESVVYGLSFAGHEIVSHLLSNSLICLLSGARASDEPRHDETAPTPALQGARAWDELCANPSLIPNALEEVLRFESPQTSWRRVANTNASAAGVRVPAGTNIFLSLAAANRQPDVFESPDAFDIHRPNARNHISFGKGIHFCLGARLARLEATIMLEELTKRIPSLSLVESQSLKRFPNITFRGPKRLLVTWDG